MKSYFRFHLCWFFCSTLKEFSLAYESRMVASEFVVISVCHCCFSFISLNSCNLNSKLSILYFTRLTRFASVPSLFLHKFLSQIKHNLHSVAQSYYPYFNSLQRIPLNITSIFCNFGVSIHLVTYSLFIISSGGSFERLFMISYLDEEILVGFLIISYIHTRCYATTLAFI